MGILSRLLPFWRRLQSLGRFGKKARAAPADWPGVAAILAGSLWQLLQTDPKILASPHVRVVLRDDWAVAIAADRRDPDRLLGSHDVCCVLLQEQRHSLARWLNALKADPRPLFQRIATEDYAEVLVGLLMERAGRPAGIPDQGAAAAVELAVLAMGELE